MNLQELHKKYSANKVYSYMSRYEELFKDLKDREIRLLELGIWKGGSLRMWRDYFSKGKITGFDRNNKWMITNEPRISTLCIDQKDIPNIGEETFFDFDIIIDDMSHVGSLTKQSFNYLFHKHLKRGGIYVIEDWQTGYRDKKVINGQMFDYEGKVYTGENHTAGMVGFIKELIDELGISYITDKRYGNGQPYKESTIDKIIIKKGIVFVYKK